MADVKITALGVLTAADPINDAIPIVDVSDFTMAASGTTKRISVNNILSSSPTATGAFSVTGLVTAGSATITGAATVGTTLGVTGASTLASVGVTGAATVGTTLAVTGAATFSGNTTLGDAQSDTATVNGQLTAYQGQLPSSLRASASDFSAVAFDGFTASTKIVSAGQAISTGDFSLWSRFRVPTSIATNQFPGILCLSDSSTTATRANALRVLMTDSGTLQVSRSGTTTSDSRTASISSFRTTYSGQVVDIVVTRSGATLKIYINGTDTAYTETTAGTPPAWSDTIVSDFVLVGCTTTSTTTIFSGRIFRSVFFNRALSASDVTEVITTGVNPADQWGTQTQVIGFNPAVLNGGFETNSLGVAGTWGTFASGTSTATIDTSGSFSRTGSNAGKLTLDALASSALFSANNGSAVAIALGKRYRISIWGRKGATSGSCGFQFGNSASGNAYGNSGLVLTTSYSNTLVEVISVTDGAFNISRQGGSAALSEIYIDDVEITRIGAIVDLDFTVGTGYQATDRSTNALHGTLFNGVEFTQPRKMAVLYATTSTSGNQQMLGTLAIPTNAVIEDIIVNSTGTVTVSVGNASAGTQIVNAASVVSGRQKLTLATPFSTTGNLWVNASSTATLQFTVIYTIAS